MSGVLSMCLHKLTFGPIVIGPGPEGTSTACHGSLSRGCRAGPGRCLCCATTST